MFSQVASPQKRFETTAEIPSPREHHERNHDSLLVITYISYVRMVLFVENIKPLPQVWVSSSCLSFNRRDTGFGQINSQYWALTNITSNIHLIF